MKHISNDMWSRFETFLYKVLCRLFHGLHKEFSESGFQLVMQFMKFCVVGISNTSVSYIIYGFSLFVIRMVSGPLQYDYILAQVIAFVLSVLWSYHWNNRYVFKRKGKTERFGRHYLKPICRTLLQVCF